MLNFLSCPRCSSQKFEAGLHRGIAVKTPDIDMRAQLVPAIILNQAVNDFLQCYSVQRIINLLFTHDPGLVILNYISIPVYNAVNQTTS